ncbi:MAG TPA: ABC transporter permease [Gemmatimonadaceae bacterium]|nr:ABC transporter permease [Gemmatimonadaceae bacterium]
MGRAPSWRRYLRFWRSDINADVDDELRLHLEMRAREYEVQGFPPDEAQRAARERFGDPERIAFMLRAHDRRRQRRHERREMMSDLIQDLRYAVRGLRHAPAFSAAAVLTLALGIGATTAIFSVVNAVILKPLPYPEPERLVMMWMDNRNTGLREDVHSWLNFADLRAENRSFGQLAAYGLSGFNITGGCVEGECQPQRVAAIASTANLFSVLGVGPALGRPYTSDEEEPGRDGVIVISHGLWMRLFGGDPAAIGRTVRVNGRERTVIGVMPRGFAYPGPNTDAWVPLAPPPDLRESRSSLWLRAIGRLAPGVSLERAATDLATVAAQLEREYPSNREMGTYLVSLPQQVVGRSLRTTLWVMLGAVVAVLLIATANVANLMLARAATREREVSVRLALGATPSRLARQLLTESVLLAVLGAALGVLLAWGGLRLLIGLAPADIPRLDEVHVDALVLGLGLVLAGATGMAFGLVPALNASRQNLSDSLREGARGTAGHRGNRMRRVLVGAQVALVVVLLTGAGLLIRSFLELQRVELGFRPDNLLTARVSLPQARYPEPAQRLAFFETLIERLRAVPGVASAGAITDIFLDATPTSTNFSIEGREFTPEEEGIEIPLDVVSTDYFRTMGIPLTRGRSFSAQDVAGSLPVVMINESMARRFWPDGDPLGKRFKYGSAGSDSPWLTIIGVVSDMRRTGYDAPVRYETFLPLSQDPARQMTLVLRTTREPLALSGPLRTEVRRVDPELPVYELATMDELLSGMVAQRRFSMALLGTFAAIALMLGVIGVYGVTAFLVAQRTREVGVRIALGAQPRQLVRSVVAQGMVVAASGLAAGLVGALLLSRLMAGILYQVSPRDLVTLASVTVLLTLATLLANYFPARRAARVDPLVALRNE